MHHFKTHEFESDILVAGGGPAGVACALAAARQGAKVILCQDRPVLGGNASSEIRMHIVGANSKRPTKPLQLEPRETGIIEEIRLENSARNPQRSPSVFDLILYEKCKAEPNLRLFLNTSVTAAVMEGSRIVEVAAIRPSTEDQFRIRSQVYVDCTGDGTLGLSAGAAFFLGRESKECFGESLGQPVADQKTLGSTLLFMGKKHDVPMPFLAPPWARKFTESDLAKRNHGHGLEYGYWWIEWGGHLDTVKENEAIRDELLAVVMGVWDHIKNGGDHSAENWALDWFGFVPGKRESRRFVGQHVLTQNDLMKSRPFADAIAYGGWPLDLHPAHGIDALDEPGCTQHFVPYLYDIPLRACVARDLQNLLFAGRNISATHVAFASTRVMATCAVIGEGVGVAAAVACEQSIPPSELAGNEAAMREVQNRLLQQDAYLINRVPKDDSLAESASVTASSEAPNGPAKNILSGQNRALSREGGVPEGRFQPGTHRWIGEPGFPAWLQLDWNKPISVRQIYLTFDTGLNRHLTMTQSEEFLAIMKWGGGQPETVKDYRVELLRAGQWTSALQEKGNWQRLRIHHLSGEAGENISAMRLVVESAWGIDQARVVSVRVY
jgi:hypothetical protein